MRPARRLLRSSLALLSTIPAALALSGGCGQASPPDARALRAAFPQLEAEVLAHGEGFRATEEGFAAGLIQEEHRAITAELPRLGNGMIRLKLRDGFEVRVRELSAEGEGVMVEKAIAYRRAGGTAYWTAAPDKVEEWLHLTARRGEVTAAWEVEGAVIEQRGENVALVDNEGTARLWVSAPAAFAAGGRPIQPVLRAANGRIELEVKDAEGEVLVDPAWSTVSPMNSARAWHTAVPITQGRVLVAGGSIGMMFLASAEAYDPGLDDWVPLPSMAKGRERHTMTALENGDVLVTGGFSGMFESSAEIFSVDTNTWMSIPPMDKGRSRHTATRLGNGRVLIVGGEGVTGVLASSQIFDPYNGYSPAPSLSTPRMNHTATLLGNGTVLVVGGKNAAALASAEVYRPNMNSWAPTSSLSTPRIGHTATLLFDGRVLVTGGFDDSVALATGEIYEPGTEKWSPIALMTEPRVNHAAVALSNGKVLVMGGSKGAMVSSTAELYDPETDQWRPAGTLMVAREGHTATRLGDGRVVIAGGKNVMATFSSVEMFTALPLAAPCMAGEECLSGFCSDGVCCNSACEAGSCDACSEAAGGAQNGICAILDGKACDDKDACTKVDTCEKDVCVGKNPVMCPQAPPCKAPACNPATGQCELKNVANGEPCQDGSMCSEMDTCMDGKCKGIERKCEAFDLCHEPGFCDPKGGMCSNPDKADCELPEDRPPKPTAPEGVTYCDEAADCPSGFCSEGVCCDSECNQKKCHSCVVPGSVGKCSPALAGTDPRNHCSAPKECTKTCSGSDDEKCVDASEGTVCLPSECFIDGIHGAMAATCSGPGAECSRAGRIPFNCSPYRCVKAMGACSTSCSELRDCAEPYVCSPEGQCVSAPAVSSGYASSCAFTPAPGSSRASFVAMLFAALLVARRRQERQERHQQG